MTSVSSLPLKFGQFRASASAAFSIAAFLLAPFGCGGGGDTQGAQHGTGTTDAADSGSSGADVSSAGSESGGVAPATDGGAAGAAGSPASGGATVDDAITGEMIVVPGGTLMLGAEVTVTEFELDATEVTVASYAACVTDGACTVPSTASYLCNWEVPGKEGHPINCVDWTQASTFCGWAAKRLPTEDEWEYAARYDDGREFPWGSEAPTSSIVCWDDSGQTCAVGSFSAGNSKLGFMDMSGNVWEWTENWYCDVPP
jgi:formylglycine-generating enzyme required for sulfatase activity